ncbi:universal stress protein [Kitasatospora sp. NPDC004240]
MKPPVLAGIDGSPESTAAARWAAEEALRREVPLRLVHAWPWLTDGASAFVNGEELPAAAQRMLTTTADGIRRRHPGLAVHTDVVLDAAVDGLVSAAEEAGLLVLGSRGLGGFTGLLVGSVGLAVAGRAATPVVLVRPREEGDASDRGGDGRDVEEDGVAGVQAGEVLLGLDARGPDDELLAFAFQAAALRGARLRVVHGWDLPPAFTYAGWIPPETELEQLQALEAKLLSLALEDFCERHPALTAGVELVQRVRLGAARSLVEASGAADLVVIGRRRRPHQLGPRLGRVAHAVLHHAQAPVAVVPHP